MRLAVWMFGYEVLALQFGAEPEAEGYVDIGITASTPINVAPQPEDPNWEKIRQYE